MVIQLTFPKSVNHSNVVALISDEDKDLLQVSWHPMLPSHSKTPYMARNSGKKNNQKTYLHRVIMERMLKRPLEKGEFVDHINMDGLDNRRENLRVATRSQNGANQGRHKDNQSGFKGIYFRKDTGKWQARIQFEGVIHYAGGYDTKEEAHEAYCKKGKELFGEFFNDGFL